MSAKRLTGIALLVSALLWYGQATAIRKLPPPGPNDMPLVEPTKPSEPKKPILPRPILPLRPAMVVGMQEGGRTGPDGKTAITCDLPESEKKHNVSGVDGLGLCVFTSIEYAARWQNEQSLINFQAQMKKEKGGGWPEKVDRMIAKYAPGVFYGQYEGTNPEVLYAAIQSGRMPGVTYAGRDVHYRGSIAHMVNLVHIDEKFAVISDNNYPGSNQFVWLTVPEFLERWKNGGNGWAVVLLKGGPPPVPCN